MLPKLSDYIGTDVTLIEKPDGHDSRHYPVAVDEKYRVQDVSGSTFRILFSDKMAGYIYYLRFKECQSKSSQQ